MKINCFECLVGLLIAFLLFSCGRSDKDSSQIGGDTSKTKAPDTLVVEYLDSTNHKQFLDKNGNYKINWGMLKDAKLELIYFPNYDAKGYYAEFGKSPLFLKDKRISIEGYVIPFLVDTAAAQYRYVLSYHPNSACFFCSGNGPETVMELKLKPNQRKFREDEYQRFTGKLVLNNGNPWMLNYLLYEAEIEN
jgi:hypothetical protein